MLQTSWRTTLTSENDSERAAALPFRKLFVENLRKRRLSSPNGWIICTGLISRTSALLSDQQNATTEKWYTLTQKLLKTTKRGAGLKSLSGCLSTDGSTVGHVTGFLLSTCQLFLQHLDLRSQDCPATSACFEFGSFVFHHCLFEVEKGDGH
jgi:hypothetical protein